MSMYLDITGIPGESQSPNPNWNQKIEVQHFTYDVSLDHSMEVGTGLASSGSRCGYMHITKVMDVSTPLLFAKLCAAEPIQNMYLRVSQPGSKGGAYGGLFEGETYQLQNVIVSHYTTSGHAGAGGLPQESWQFAFQIMTETYQTVDAQGNLQPGVTVGQDFGQGVQTA